MDVKRQQQHDLSKANHMTVNVGKSKVVVFNNLAKWAGSVLYAGAPLPVVKEFVYLGTCFYSACNSRGSIRKNLKRRLIKAKVALNCMKQRCRQLDLHHVIIMCGLFDSLVKSVINFGCERVAYSGAGQTEVVQTTPKLPKKQAKTQKG